MKKSQFTLCVNNKGLEKIRDRLNKNRFTILHYDFLNSPYGYTVGNTLLGLPELIVFGGSAGDSLNLLSSASQYQQRHPDIADGQDFDFPNEPGWRFAVKDVPPINAIVRMSMLALLFGKGNFRVRQLINAVDKKYPWQKGYDRSLEKHFPCLWK